MNAFESLSLPTQLLLTENAIKEAYDQTSRLEQHLTARNTLINPTSRLKEWMEVQEIEIARHSSIPDELISLFSALSGLINDTKQLSQKRENSTTLLAQTLVDKQLFQKKPKLDELARAIQQYRDETLSTFPEIEKKKCTNTANKSLQTLKFLQKWEYELDNAYTMLL